MENDEVPVAPRVKLPCWITRGVSIAALMLGLGYPFFVYKSWHQVNPRLIMGGAFLLLGLRLALIGSHVDRSQWKSVVLPWVFPGLFLFIAFCFGRRSLALYWPVVISATLLFVFGRTLIRPPPLVERFARLQKADLTHAEISYCRIVTQLWCLFFVANGTIAWSLAYGGGLKAWTLYNGFIAYLLIGGFMALEYVCRHWKFRPKDALLTNWMNYWTR